MLKARSRIVNDLNTTITGMEEVKYIGDFILSRIDLCYNYQVGDYVPDYISAIQMNYPRRNWFSDSNHSRRGCGDTRDNGISYWSKQVVSSFYDKQRECGELDAYGLLRHEVSIRDQYRLRGDLRQSDSNHSGNGYTTDCELCAPE